MKSYKKHREWWKNRLEKLKLKSSKLPREIAVNKEDLFDETKIVHGFNSLFTDAGKNLASKIPNPSASFEYFENKSEILMETTALSMNELKDAFYSLKSNKDLGCGDISDTVIKKYLDSLCEPWKYLFSL